MLADLAQRTARPVYQPRGAAAVVQTATEPEILLCGPAGTGKSRAALEKMHRVMLAYPGARALMVRKTRASLTDSGLVTYEQKVLGEDNPICASVRRENRHAYYYPNGSEVVVGGMDKASRVMSTEYDLIIVLEATELTLNDWESLTTRNRNNVVPVQQIIGDCNPDRPDHWLKLRCDAGATRYLASYHRDNPVLYDAASNLTPFGAIYMAKLDRLSGARRERLRDGRWTQAEGVVYEDFDYGRHVIDSFPIPAAWSRYRAVDFGYTNPFVCQWWAVDDDGRAYLYREIYRTHRLVEDHAAQIKQLSQGEKIVWTIADTEAEGCATLTRHGVPVIAAQKAISTGIQAVQTRLRVAGDGKPRLFFFRDALVEPDPLLVEAKLPTSTIQEITGYTWPVGVDGKPYKEVPVDADNHGMDALRYFILGLARRGSPITFSASTRSA